MKNLHTLSLLCFLAFASILQAQNPYAEYGIKTEVLTLSGGKYDEFVFEDTVVQIGSVLFNTNTNQIVSFIQQDTAYSEATLKPEVISRWLSPDPLAAKYPYLTPYNFVDNSPMIHIDPDGRVIQLAYITYSNTGDPVTQVVTYTNGKLIDKNGNEYSGNNQFLLNTQQTLNNIKSLDERANTLVTDLETSTQNHVISNVDAQLDKANSNPNSSRTRKNTDEGGGSVVRYMPEQDRTREDTKDFSNEEILGHELKHSWNIDKKKHSENLSKKSTNGKTSMEEVDAVNFQNVIRDKQGKAPRTTYGKSKIPASELTPASDYKIEGQ